ncbi:MAG: tRNA dihydrouridine synthase DusB [Myxococcales bacterium]|nr:tRNA dihydrouridine synthase DusB [Myxococcales bacterium]
MVATPQIADPSKRYVVDPDQIDAIDLSGESAWWEDLSLISTRIGPVEIPNRYFLAPMCDVTNLPYRVIARTQGASLLATEMLSSVALAMGGHRTFHMMEFLPDEKPIMVQISGTDPDIMRTASLMIQDYGASILNLNCGCPVKKVIKGGSGSALLRDKEVLRKILRTLRPVLEIPLTVKMRAGWDAKSVNAVDIAKMCEDEGVDSVMLHGRTRKQMYEGKANWDLIGEVVQAVSIPVIGNGDIFTGADAHRMLEHTGCEAVMLARGAIGNPWIFRECIALELEKRGEKNLPPGPPTPEERLEIIWKHFELFAAYAGRDRALVRIRKQLMAYVRGLPGSSAFRARLSSLSSEENLRSSLAEFLIENRRASQVTDETHITPQRAVGRPG